MHSPPTPPTITTTAAPPPPESVIATTTTTTTTTAAATVFAYLANSLAELAPSSSPPGLALANKTSRGFVRLDCAAGGELLAWNDATLWVFFLLYLFVGIYVICDYYFVPALEVIGEKLQWSESIQGASLMAAGSSFPEFLTALFGVLFFSDENPGPATNIGSAVFNICIIVSLSILFLPKLSPGQSPFRLHPVAFSRDCGFFVLATVESYIFFEVLSPGELEWLETLTMTATYALYLVSLFVTDRFVQFGPKPAQALDHDHGETLELVPLEVTSGGTKAPNFASDDVGQTGESDLDDDEDETGSDDEDNCHDGDSHSSNGYKNSFDIEASTGSNAENTHNSSSSMRSPRMSISGGASTNADILCNSPGAKIGATTPMPIAALSIDGSLRSSGSNGCWACSKPILVKILHALEFPYKLVFRLTIPSVRLPAVVESPPASSSSGAESGKGHAAAAAVSAAAGGEGPPRRTICTVLTFFISMAVCYVCTLSLWFGDRHFSSTRKQYLCFWMFLHI